MRFVHPEFLWLLVLVPLLALASGRRGPAPSFRYPSADLIRAMGRGSRTRFGGVLLGLRLLAIAAMIVGLARPQQGLGAGEVETSGIDIVLAIDVSGSMRALDFELAGRQVSRLEAVRSVVTDFVEARQGDRIALVAFAGRPYLVSPLTLDHDWILQNLDRLQIGMVEDGTAIGSALAAAVARLEDREASSRIVILLTDGVNNAGKVSPLMAAQAARALGLKAHTILAGTGGEVPIPTTDQFGRRRIVTARVDVDPETLGEVATITGGRFFRATDTDSLAQIYDEIDAMEKTTAVLNRFESYRELYPWFIAGALSLLALEFLLGQTRLRRLP